MLSNKWYYVGASKYILHSLCRTQVSDEESYKSVYETEDEEGNRGIALSKKITEVAGKAITINLKTIAIKVLPMAEKIKVALSVRKKNGKRKITYTPHIKRAVQHLCIHPGGRAVLDTLQEKLSLSEDDMKPSRRVLHKYGNTSSSSIWYELDFLEQEKRVKQGDKVLQIAFGSGFKCNSLVWKKL
jgi:3-ketoacyl-CoA synthase